MRNYQLGASQATNQPAYKMIQSQQQPKFISGKLSQSTVSSAGKLLEKKVSATEMKPPQEKSPTTYYKPTQMRSIQQPGNVLPRALPPKLMGEPLPVGKPKEVIEILDSEEETE